MPRSWQLRLATVLAGLNVVFGAAVLAAVGWSFTQEPDVLFAVYASVAGAVASAGVWMTVAAISHTSRLRRGESGARVQTLAVGASFVMLGFGLLLVVPWLGLVLVIDGATIAGLMLTHAVEQDLGPWIRDGSIWQRSPRVYRLKAPTRVRTSSAAPPWWEQLSGERAQGLPTWLRAVGGAAVLLFAVTGLLLLRDGGVFGLASGTTLLAGAGLAWLVYRHLRARLQH